LLTFCRPIYQNIVLDLPEIYDDELEVLLADARDVYVVISPEKPAELLARRAFRLLESFQVDQERTHVVLSGCEQERQIKECQESLGRPIKAVLPGDLQAVQAAFAGGGVVQAHTKLGRALAALARQVLGIDPIDPLENEKETGLLSWLGLGSRN
jgi:Flp pilus assembly CpaE family ATPase